MNPRRRVLSCSFEPFASRSLHALGTAALGSALLAGCAGSMSSAPRSDPPGSSSAIAELKPTQGNLASGTVWLVQEGDHVVITTQIRGLKPNQEHGFHAHEKGDCSSADASSAGGHFNPTHKPHGAPDHDHHAGDFPALRADAAGVAAMRFSVQGTLVGVGVGVGDADLVGKALVVHADRDDYVTQPSGNSGARIACGVVLAAKT